MQRKRAWCVAVVLLTLSAVYFAVEQSHTSTTGPHNSGSVAEALGSKQLVATGSIAPHEPLSDRSSSRTVECSVEAPHSRLIVRTFPFSTMWTASFLNNVFQSLLPSVATEGALGALDEHLSRAARVSRKRGRGIAAVPSSASRGNYSVALIIATRELLTCTAAFVTWIVCFPNASSSHVSYDVPPVVLDCIRRHGLARVDRWVPSSCRATRFWSAFLRYACGLGDCTTGDMPLSQTLESKFGDVISRMQRWSGEPRPAFRPVAARTIAPFGPPVECTTERNRVVRLHPIGFSVPEDAVHSTNPTGSAVVKLFDFSLAGAASSKHHKPFDTSGEFLQWFDLRHSVYGITVRRWGWDCLRHYEMLASGVLPYFVDLPIAPDTVLSALPKHQLLTVLRNRDVAHIGAVWNDVPFEQSHPHAYFEYSGLHQQDGGAHVKINDTVQPFLNESVADWESIARRRHELLEYTRHNLTTAACAAYLLDRMGHPNATRILLLHGVAHMDFLKVSLHHGLVNGLGLFVTAYPDAEEHYVRRRPVHSMQALESLRRRYLSVHGNGFTYGFRVYRDGDLAEEAASNRGLKSSSDVAILRGIVKQDWDVVIFTFTREAKTLERQLPFFHEVVQHYAADRIAFINGDDVFAPPEDGQPHRLVQHATKYGHVFVRELYALQPQCPEQIRHPLTSGKSSNGSHLPKAQQGNATVVVEESLRELLSNSSEVVALESAFATRKRVCALATVAHASGSADGSQWAATANDVVITHGESGAVRLGQLLRSLRRSSGDAMRLPMVVILVWRQISLDDLAMKIHSGEWDAYRPFVVEAAPASNGDDEGQRRGASAMQRRFHQALLWLVSRPLLLGVDRWCVIDTTAARVLFRGDLFASVGLSTLWFSRHDVHHNAALTTQRQCFAAEDSDVSRYLVVAHEVFGGRRLRTLTHVLAVIDLQLSHVTYSFCGIDVAINMAVREWDRLHDQEPRHVALFGAERGPIVYDASGECDSLRSLVKIRRTGEKDVRLLCATHYDHTAALVVGNACSLLDV